MQMTRLQKSIAQTLLDLALELGHHYSFSPHVMGVNIYRTSDCHATDTLYLDAPEKDLISKLDKVVQQAYEL
jgi:hypothetical protein